MQQAAAFPQELKSNLTHVQLLVTRGFFSFNFVFSLSFNYRGVIYQNLQTASAVTTSDLQ